MNNTSLEPNLGAAYFWLTLVKGGRDLQSHAFEDWMEEGHRALGVMEKHIALHDFFAADRTGRGGGEHQQREQD